MTKSNLKNEELALAYSSRERAHNGEEDVESGIQSRKLADSISSHRKPWTGSSVRLYKPLKPTSLMCWNKAPCPKIPPSPQTSWTGSQILKCVSLWGTFFIQIVIVVSPADKRMWSSEKLRNCLMSLVPGVRPLISSFSVLLIVCFQQAPGTWGKPSRTKNMHYQVVC